MRPRITTFPSSPALAAVLAAASLGAGCGDAPTVGARSGSVQVPVGAVRVDALASTEHRLSIREIGTSRPPVDGTVSAFIADSAVEMANTGANVGVVLGVDNFDPDAPTGCHPSALVRDSRCPDRAQFPYILLPASPIQEVYLGGEVCQAVPGASAAETTIDDQGRLLKLRAVAPAFCGTELRTFEITLTRPAGRLESRL